MSRGLEPVRDVSSANFGYLIAYILPGFLLLAALKPLLPGVEAILNNAAAAGNPSVGGFLYATLASVAAGLTASTMRWLVIDSIHHRTGIARPAWDDAALQSRLQAFEALVDAHYRYYQYYANTTVSLIVLLIVDAARGQLAGIDAIAFAAIPLHWSGSRDTLRRYYRRAERLLGVQPPPRSLGKELHMTNGHHPKVPQSPSMRRAAITEASSKSQTLRSTAGSDRSDATMRPRDSRSARPHPNKRP